MGADKFIEPCQVFVDVDVTSKGEALEFFAEKGAELGIGSSAGEILGAFRAREDLGPTGMEGGLAIPHAKSDAISRPAVCLAKFSRPLEWESLDGQPVTVAVALYGPESEAGSTHVRYLSKVAVMASRPGFSSFISSGDDPQEIATRLSDGILG